MYYESTEKNKLSFQKSKTQTTQEKDSPSNKKIPQLRTKGKDTGFKEFKETLERQAREFPDFFFLESPESKKEIALTFDDGPDLQFTPKVLDVLKEYNIKATFFLVGFKMQRHPEVVRRIYEEGHSVGNHTFSHPDFNLLTKEEVFEKQIERCEAVFNELLLIQPTMIRPPYGKIKDEQIKFLGEKGYRIIDWSIDTYDWDEKQNSKEEIMERISSYAHEGAIILMHSGGDNKENTIRALPEIIKDLREKGYEIVTVPEMLKIPTIF